jgi:peptidoglycan/LPS O-acetylase OafA/YrhL
MSAEHTDRIHCLDGWRGIAIVLVLVAHFKAAFHGDHSLNLGGHGVQIFFVLSGYLITTQIARKDRINLKSFYIRRAFRILPPALLYLLTLVMLTSFTPFRVAGSDVWACLFFFRNYLGETVANTCTLHFWSLSLEEQFYLFWPALLLLLGRKRALYAAVGLAVAVAVFRFENWSYYGEGLRVLRTEVRADGLLIGCALALSLNYLPFRQWVQKAGMWLFWPALAVFVIDVSAFGEYISLNESIAIAVMLGVTSLRPETPIGRALDWDFLKTTGVLSYSIYIWQGLFLRPNWGGFWPILLMSAVFISYFVVEQPARKLGRRLAEHFEQDSNLLASRNVGSEPAELAITHASAQ